MVEDAVQRRWFLDAVRVAFVCLDFSFLFCIWQRGSRVWMWNSVSESVEVEVLEIDKSYGE